VTERATAPRRRRLHVWLTLALVAGALYFALRGLSFTELVRAFERAELLYLVYASALLAAAYATRGVRWYYLFPAEVRATGVQHATGILLVGFLLNNLLPARAGELVRVVLMARHNRVKASGTLATLVVERVFDGALLGVIALLAAQGIAGEQLRWLRQLALLFGGLFVLLLLLATFHRRVAAQVQRATERFPGHLSGAATRSIVAALDFLGSLASVGGLLRGLALTALVWSLEAAVYASVARAFGEPLGIMRVGAFLSAVNFASLAPIPGGVGVVELAGTGVLSASGVARETAFVMVSTQHALQYGFCLIAGGFFAGRLGFTWGSRVVEPFRALVDVESLLSEPPRAHASIAEYLRSVPADAGPQLSLVVPAYDEEKRILSTLLTTIDYLRNGTQSFELIVVDDGSRDATAEVVRQLARRVPQLKLLCLPKNCGKGAAVRAGVRSARGELVLFADADGATPIAELERLLAAVNEGADVAVGSRALWSQEVRVERTLKRAVVGRTFAFLVNSWVVPGVADTQCGFKLFRRAAAEQIFALQQLDGFAFDVELLKLAAVLQLRVAEVPVNWADQPGSKVNIVSDSFRMLWDVLRIPYLRSVTRATASLPPGVQPDRAPS
jgi:dolichyl-phosphate beta-glucosyltransferase